MYEILYLINLNSTEAVSYPPCVDRLASANGRVEDIFCMVSILILILNFIFNLLCLSPFKKEGIYLYLYKYENVCVSVCLCVCVFAFFSAIWNPIGIPFGTNVLCGLEMVLKQ